MISPLSSLARLAANGAWQGSDWADAQLLPHAGKTLSIEVWPLASIALRVSAEGKWEDVSVHPATVDATLRMTPSVLGRLAQLPDKPGAALDLAGDTAFVDALRALHDVLPLTLEDRLSALAGPIITHALSTTLRSVASWPAQAAERLQAGAAAYWIEEAPMLVDRRDFTRFADDLDALVKRSAALIEKHQL